MWARVSKFALTIATPRFPDYAATRTARSWFRGSSTLPRLRQEHELSDEAFGRSSPGGFCVIRTTPLSPALPERFYSTPEFLGSVPNHNNSLVQSQRHGPNSVTVTRPAQLCQERTGMQNILLHVPALSAKAGGLSGSYLGRSVGTISALVVVGRSTRDATGAENWTRSIHHPVAV